MLNYTDRTRNIEEVAILLKVPLVITKIPRDHDLWQVKLSRVRFIDKSYAFVRHNNPNSALSSLCQKLSCNTIIAPDKRVIQLGEVVRTPLRIILYEEKKLKF